MSFLILLLLATHAHAQEMRRWEVGAQLVRMDLTPIGESPLGAGGRVSYFINRFVAMETEANRYFEDASHNFGHTQLMAGGRAGVQFGPVGIYAKARPGWLHLGGGTALRNPGREDHFSLDLGGVVTIGRGRAAFRIDAGDDITFWGSQPFSVGIPEPLTKHNRQLSVGFVIRL